MSFTIERYTQFVNDCEERGIGLPSIKKEEREIQNAIAHCRLLRNKGEPDTSKRFWAGSMTERELSEFGAVPWFTYASGPKYHDTGALRSLGGEQFWKERAELAEDLSWCQDSHISIPKVALDRFVKVTRSITDKIITRAGLKEIQDALFVMDMWFKAEKIRRKTGG